MFEGVNVVTGAVGLFLTIFAAVWSLAWWLSGQFTNIRNLVYSSADKTLNTIMTKLEYHEKHDDNRFGNIRNDIWDLRVNLASRDARDGIKSNLEKNKPLVDE